MRFTYVGMGAFGGRPSEAQIEWAKDDRDKLVMCAAWKMLTERDIPTSMMQDEYAAIKVGADWTVTCRHTNDPTLLLTDRFPIDITTDYVLWGHSMRDGVMLILGIISRQRLGGTNSARQLLRCEEWLRAFKPDPQFSV